MSRLQSDPPGVFTIEVAPDVDPSDTVVAGVIADLQEALDEANRLHAERVAERILDALSPDSREVLIASTLASLDPVTRGRVIAAVEGK